MGRSKIYRRVSDTLRRLRHFRGHGVHSPYIYQIKREIFMRKKLIEPQNLSLIQALEALNVSRQVVVELHNIYTHCGYEGFAVDPKGASDKPFIVLTQPCSDEWKASVEQSGTTVVLLGLRQWGRACLDHIIAKHPSTTVERRDYLLIFNNHLPKQHFIL